MKKGATAAERGQIAIMEKWKSFVAIKRVFRYWLGYANSRGEYGKADMYWAFNRWRLADTEVRGSLSRRTRIDLSNVNLYQGRVLARCAQREAEGSFSLSHLSMARDELIDHQARAQKLALAACSDAHKHSRERLWEKWRAHKQSGVRAEYRDRVLDGVEQITEMKNS